MDNYDIVEISGYWAWQFDKQADKLKSFDKCKDWRMIKPKKTRQKDICDCRVAFVTENVLDKRMGLIVMKMMVVWCYKECGMKPDDDIYQSPPRPSANFHHQTSF